MSLANPALQPTKLIDEDYEIRSHGTSAKDPKLAGMSLIEQFDYSISLSHEKHKAAEDSLTQLEVGGESGGEGEEPDEGEEEEGGEGEEEEEEEFVMCDICLKDNEHWTFECPYLDHIPNPKEATLGKGYDIVCTHCNMFGGHSDREWEGRAIIKFCGICDQTFHWSAECPKKDQPPQKKSLLECAAEYESRLAMKKSRAV